MGKGGGGGGVAVLDETTLEGTALEGARWIITRR